MDRPEFADAGALGNGLLAPVVRFAAKVTGLLVELAGFEDVGCGPVEPPAGCALASRGPAGEPGFVVFGEFGDGALLVGPSAAVDLFDEEGVAPAPFG